MSTEVWKSVILATTSLHHLLNLLIPTPLVSHKLCSSLTPHQPTSLDDYDQNSKAEGPIPRKKADLTISINSASIFNDPLFSSCDLQRDIFASPVNGLTAGKIGLSTPHQEITSPECIRSITIRRHKPTIPNSTFVAPPLVLFYPPASSPYEMSRKWHSQSKGLLCTSPLAQRFDPTTLYSMASPGTFGVSTVSVLQTLDRWHACTASSLHKSLLSVQSAMKGTGDSVLERFYGSDRNTQERSEGYPAKLSDTSKQLTFLSNHHPNQTLSDQWLETRCSDFPTNSQGLSRKRAIETPAHTPLHTARRRSARVLKANRRRAKST